MCVCVCPCPLVQLMSVCTALLVQRDSRSCRGQREHTFLSRTQMLPNCSTYTCSHERKRGGEQVVQLRAAVLEAAGSCPTSSLIKKSIIYNVFIIILPVQASLCISFLWQFKFNIFQEIFCNSCSEYSIYSLLLPLHTVTC